jgi:hypothetical protein
MVTSSLIDETVLFAGVSHCPKGCDSTAPNDPSGSAFTNGMVLAANIAALTKFTATTGTMACPKGCDSATPQDTAASSFTNGMVTSSLIDETVNIAGSSHCPSGCDAALPNDPSGSAFTNGMVTGTKVAALNSLGTHAPTTDGSISTAEWNLVANMACSSSAASAAHGDFTIAAAAQQNSVCVSPLSDNGVGNPNTCASTRDNVNYGTITMTASANDVGNICVSTR